MKFAELININCKLILRNLINLDIKLGVRKYILILNFAFCLGNSIFWLKPNSDHFITISLVKDGKKQREYDRIRQIELEKQAVRDAEKAERVRRKKEEADEKAMKKAHTRLVLLKMKKFGTIV